MNRDVKELDSLRVAPEGLLGLARELNEDGVYRDRLLSLAISHLEDALYRVTHLVSDLLGRVMPAEEGEPVEGDDQAALDGAVGGGAS
jgi:hypothetical protein